MSTENNVDEQVKVNQLQDLRHLTQENDVEPAYQAALDLVNTKMKDVPHFLKTTVELQDPALVMLLTSHIEAKCRLQHDPHEFRDCLRKQHDRWMERMSDIAKQQKIDIPSFSAAEVDQILDAYVARAQKLVDAGGTLQAKTDDDKDEAEAEA